MKIKVSFTFPDGLPNLTTEEKNSDVYISLSYKLKHKPTKISSVPAIGMKIMINSFYTSYKLNNDEGLLWDKAFDVEEDLSFEIYAIGIRKKYLILILK